MQKQYSANDGILNYNDFVEKISQFEESKTILDKTANCYSKIPAIFKSLKSIDPTGITSLIADSLDANKSSREKEALLRAFYSLYLGIKNIENKLEEIVVDKIASLVQFYFQYCRTSEFDKIEYFKNIFITGITNREISISEDKNIFSILDKLDPIQIHILKILYDKQKNRTYHSLRGDVAFKINVVELANELTDISESKLKQLCSDLIGKGLIEDWGLGRMDYNGPENFIINDYTKFFIERILNL